MILKSAAIILVIVIVLSSCTTAIRQRNIEIKITGDNLEKLDGSIIVEVTDKYLGAVFPSINLSENYILEFNVSQIGSDSYQVESVIKIDVEVLGNLTKKYLLGRYLTVCVLILREIGGLEDSNRLSRGRIINRLIWSIDRFKLNSEGIRYVEIPLQYETNDVSENASMFIFALGTPTGILARGKPVFARGRIELEFLYNISDIIDQTPPVTVCILEGKIR